jgi:hypothetical protein
VVVQGCLSSCLVVVLGGPKVAQWWSELIQGWLGSDLVVVWG